jgi:hypothetical protein
MVRSFADDEFVPFVGHRIYALLSYVHVTNHASEVEHLALRD